MRQFSKSKIRKYGADHWSVPFGKTRLRHAQFLQILWGFVHDDTAVRTAQESGVSVRTVNNTYRALRIFAIADPLITAMSDTPYTDEQNVRDYHFERHGKHPGWRDDEEYIHWDESYLRYTIYRHQPVTFFSRMLEALYARPLQRART